MLYSLEYNKNNYMRYYLFNNDTSTDNCPQVDVYLENQSLSKAKNT